MELAIAEFEMEKLNKMLAVRTLLMYSFDFNLPLYFINQTIGIEEGIHIGEEFDNNGDFVGMSIANAEDLKEVYGAKRVERAYVFSRSSSSTSDEESIYVSIRMFSKDDVIYNIADEGGDKFLDIDVKYEELYFNKEELNAFKKAMESTDKQTTQPQYKDISLSGEMKALALVAREMADQSDKYKTGNRVNSSAVQSHIIQLATEHEISTSGLRSLDDKLNKALDHHDLKLVKRSQTS